MHRSAKETKVLHPVSRALQMDYRASLECAGMLDEPEPSGTPDRRPEPGVKQTQHFPKL